MIFRAPSAQEGTQIPQPLHLFSSIFTTFLVVFHCFPLSSSALVGPHSFSLLPLNCCQRSSPRHCRADAHQEMQEGICSGKPSCRISGTLPGFRQKRFQLRRRQFEHLNNSTRSYAYPDRGIYYPSAPVPSPNKFNNNTLR